MDRLFGTTMVIDEATMTVKRRSFIKISLIFSLVFFIGSMLSSILLMIPTYGYVFSDGVFAEKIANATEYDDIYKELDHILAHLPEWLNAFSLIATFGTIVAAIVYCTKYERRRLFTLGFIKKGAVNEYLSGLIIGLAMFGAAFGIIAWCHGFYVIEFNAEVSVPMILLFFTGFLIQGMSEEVLLRGYYFVSVATGGNIPLAVFASSAFFALLHFGNSGVSVMGILNIFLFGVFAALYFLRRGSIWGIAAIHSMWNFAQGNIFGCLVSGTNAGESLLFTEHDYSKTLLNGGEFGPEGGLAVTIVLFIGIVVLLFMKNKEVQPEINFDKEFYSA